MINVGITSDGDDSLLDGVLDEMDEDFTAQASAVRCPKHGSKSGVTVEYRRGARPYKVNGACCPAHEQAILERLA